MSPPGSAKRIGVPLHAASSAQADLLAITEVDKVPLTCRSARRPGSASARILMSVYSCGPTPSPLARSWSAQGCPSLGEYTA